MKTIFATERLELLEFNLSDAYFILTLMNSQNWIKGIGDKGIKTITDAEKYIENSLINSYSTQGFGLYKMVLKSNHTAIGMCGLVQRTYLDYVDLGFAILQAYERQGLTYEAALGMISYTRSVLNISDILAITDLDNIGSRKLLERLNFQSNGIVTTTTGEELLLYKSTIEVV